MENKDTIENLARTFKIFGDATRIKIMYTMLDREICVQDIAKLNLLSHTNLVY